MYETSSTHSSGISLKTQLYGLVFFLALMSFFSSLIMSVDHTRNYLNEQMGIHAQDAATSLGLSISPYLGEENIVIAETMMAAIFDSGYYASMVLVSPANKNLLSMNHPSTIEGVPQWFIDLFPLSPPTRNSEVSSGWTIAGTLHVTSHPGVSYLQLWNYSLNALSGLLFTLVASLLVAYIIIKAVLRPLYIVTEQANAITKKQFIYNKRTPITKELRLVTSAINSMVKNVQKTFISMTDHTEILTKEAYKDNLSQMGNRRAFENQLHSHFDERRITQASIVLITLPSLQNINLELGYKDGDEYILKAVKIIKLWLSNIQGTQFYRIAGGCFIVTFPVSLDLCIKNIENAQKKLNAFNSNRYSNGFAKIVMCSYNKKDNTGDLLSRLDTLSTQHKALVSSADAFNEYKAPALGLQEWKILINDIISSGDIAFSFQPVVLKDKPLPLYSELFTHFTHNNESINNGQFFAMAERLDLTSALDKKLIMAFTNLKKHYQDQRFAINLSDQSLHDEEFLSWLENYIPLNKETFENIVFEINESSLLNDIDSAKEVIALLKQHDIKVCIERFGSNLSSFKYLRGLNVDYVKLDGSYTRDLISNPDNNYFIHAVNQICQGLGITVIACHIENEETFEKILDLSIGAYQGKYLQSPHKITINHKKTNSQSHTFNLELAYDLT
jgi:EAL domain-containing protein (putative c-di-GMP-specific phosphodiesterase class I)/GGDEF domain-containing protein